MAVKVVALFNHMDEVQAKRTATLNRLDTAKESGVLNVGTIPETEFVDMVDESTRHEVIEKSVLAKRMLFLRRGEELAKSSSGQGGAPVPSK